MEVYYYKVLTRYMKQHIICDVKDLYYTCFKKKLLGGGAGNPIGQRILYQHKADVLL